MVKEGLSKVDQAITVINFMVKKKRKRIEEMSRRVEITDSQKIFIGEETDLIRNIDVLIKQCKNTFNEHLGKLPPQAIDLESSVLGAAILENGAFEKVKNFLMPEHFYNENNAIVWQAVLRAGKDQTFRVEADHNGNAVKIWDNPIDMRKVVDQLRKTNEIEQIGGAAYIAELTCAVSSAANIEYHARVIIEYAIKRKLIIMAGQVLHDAYNDSSDCFELLESSEEQIKSIRTWIK